MQTDGWFARQLWIVNRIPPMTDTRQVYYEYQAMWTLHENTAQAVGRQHLIALNVRSLWLPLNSHSCGCSAARYFFNPRIRCSLNGTILSLRPLLCLMSNIFLSKSMSCKRILRHLIKIAGHKRYVWNKFEMVFCCAAATRTDSLLSDLRLVQLANIQSEVPWQRYGDCNYQKCEGFDQECWCFVRSVEVMSQIH